MHTQTIISAICMLLLTQNVLARADVESRTNSSIYNDQPVASKYVARTGNKIDNNLEILTKLEQVQQDLQELRGRIEVQEHEIETLHNQQRSLYADLEQRLNKLNSQTTIAHKPATQNDFGAETTNKQPRNEAAQYRAAYNLLKSKQYTEAKVHFANLVKQYPLGKFTANSYYWLGELNLLEGNNQEAQQDFQAIVTHFADHQKASDAQLKLGIMAKDSGEFNKARQFFKQVQIDFPDSSAASIASKQLSLINSYQK